jgi:hypothetical protein
VEGRRLMVIEILSWIHRLIFDNLNYFIHAKRQERTHYRSKPVYVMVSWEVPRDDARSERSRGIERAPCKEHTNHFCDKQRKPYADRSEKCRLVLLSSEHEDCKDEQGREKHLKEDPHRGCYAVAKGGGHVELAGQYSGYDSSGGHAGEHLGEEAEDCADGLEGAD